MKNEIEDLQSKRGALYNEISRLNDRIREIELEEGLNILSKYIGKYFKEKTLDIVYYISETSQLNNHPRLLVLSVVYYGTESYTSITLTEFDKDQLNDLNEITKDDFMINYNKAHEILTKRLLPI